MSISSTLTFLGGGLTLVATFFIKAEYKKAALIIGGLLTLFGTLMSSIEQDKLQNKLTDTQNKLKATLEENYKITKKSLDYFTSANSYARVEFTGQDLFQFAVINEGENPLYDLTIRFVNIDQYLNNNELITEELIKNNINIGTLAPKSLHTIRKLYNIDELGYLQINVFFTDRNSYYTQKLRILKTEKGWCKATEINKENKIIYKNIDEDFPRNEDGSVMWDLSK